MIRDPLLDAMAGNYRLVARLGAGGMGEVYKGIHETIGSRVAIKLLHAMAARDRGMQERFLLEAKAVNRIDHPGVVRVLDAGRMDNGRPFLVMELLDGSSLHELRKQGKLPLPDACRAMIDVLDALSAAHAAGVIHRDLKPANLFQTRDGRTVVLDFGVAKLMASDNPARLTLTGSAVGTPHYMAPEQIKGNAATPAVDIYAAGVVLFELLCGRRPFDSSDEQGVLLGHLERRPPPPRALEPSIPIAVQDVILTALAKDPAKRHASAAAMRDALRSAVEGVAFTPHGPPDARSPWARPASAESVPTIPRVPPSPPSLGDTTPDAPHAFRENPPDDRRSDQPRAADAPKPIPETPTPVVVARARAARMFILIGGIAVIGIGAAIGFAVRRSASERAASQTPTPRIIDASSTADAAVVVQALDATDPWSVDAGLDATDATCASIVTVDPIDVATSRRAEVKATLFRRCEEDHWAAPAIACYLARGRVCAEQLTIEQAALVRRALAPHHTKKAPPDPRADDLFDNPFAEATDATVEIDSTPRGAKVSVDGKVVGTTPIAVKLLPKPHTVVLRLDGYKTRATTVSPKQDRRNVLDVRLDKNPSVSPYDELE